MFRLLRVAYSTLFKKIVANVYFFAFDLTPLQAPIYGSKVTMPMQSKTLSIYSFL
jgi:hypothetical protein